MREELVEHREEVITAWVAGPFADYELEYGRQVAIDSANEAFDLLLEILSL